ncbi:MAG: ribosome-associated translation inhibitor RaiA [Deltaproteobacteria bacterium]|nr:MAG: ribosome-associated translation inhibitor RaiA [Deltaproteobacteria bacterium]
MQFSVTFRQMEATDALKDYAKERMQRIKKYFPDPISCHVVMSTERYKHRVDVNLQLHNGLQIAGHEATEDMYSSIDLVVAKIERQVRRYKDKLRDHKPRTDVTPMPYAHTVLEETPAPDARPPEPAPPAPRVVKRDKFVAHPLTVDEAIMQLNLADLQFLVFRNADTGQVNVVYRRDDDSYGLIETEAATA